MKTIMIGTYLKLFKRKKMDHLQQSINESIRAIQAGASKFSLWLGLTRLGGIPYSRVFRSKVWERLFTGTVKTTS
jgi:hypothetical protein